MVKKSFNMLNVERANLLRRLLLANEVRASLPQLSLYTNMVSEDNHWPDSPDVKISKSNNYNDGALDKKPKHKYVKVLVKDPFNNRDILLKLTKKQRGIYLFESLYGEQKYVGHSINLYNRISRTRYSTLSPPPLNP